MTHIRELLAHFAGHPIFNENLAADIEIAAHREASGLHSGLKIHAVIDYVGNELGVRQRLVGASHDAKPDVVIATLHERRNNGVEWTLVSGERVRFGGIQQEECSAILQEKSHASYGNARAKT